MEVANRPLPAFAIQKIIFVAKDLVNPDLLRQLAGYGAKGKVQREAL